MPVHMAAALGKKHPSVGACGLDCVLCPKYYTEGRSKCGGCGSEYSYAAVGCKIFRCCVKEKGRETCADCADLPCERLKGADDTDSFVSHRRMMANLRFIREHGLDEFRREQGRREELLQEMLDEFNDGRSKSLFCVAAALLPLEALEGSITKARGKMVEEGTVSQDLKGRARALRECLEEAAASRAMDLALRRAGRRR